MARFNLNAIQKTLTDFKLNGWLFSDYRGNDPLGKRILNLSNHVRHTRRWYYFIPQSGVPMKIVHSIERDILDSLPGKKIVYMGWQEMEAKLKSLFNPGARIAVQYSPNNAIPYVSRLDAGTYELLHSFKLKLISSADLLQLFVAKWTDSQLNTHKNAARQLYEVVENTFRYVKRKVKGHQEINELKTQKYVMTEIKRRGLIFDHVPIVAVGKNSGIPHYYPSPDRNDPVYRGSLLQLNLWAKEKGESAVYAIIAWVGYIGDQVPAEYSEKFKLICDARDSAVKYIDSAMKKGKAIHGWEVDEMVRNHLAEQGYDSYFLHRTGHSIGRQVHDTGVNIDNLETRDERQIIAKTCFTIEPALYFSDYGMRTEINVFVDSKGAHVYTQPIQTEIVPILR